jgi:hypothetical protein
VDNIHINNEGRTKLWTKNGGKGVRKRKEIEGN